MPKPLPAQPSLEHLKSQARDLLAAFRSREPAALALVRTYFPDAADLKLSQAQLALAREYGFSSWAKLKERVLPRPIPGSTPLSEAVMAQDLERAKRLLDAGAEPGDNDSLYHAMETQAPDLMVLLLERGAKLEMETNALAHLLDGEKPDWLTAALEFVDDPKALPPVLPHALRRGRSAETFRILLDAGVDPGVPDDAGRTPYQSAIRMGRADVAVLLEKAGADTTLSPIDTVLGELARGESVYDISAEVIEDVDASRLLIRLAERGENQPLSALLAAGADPNVRDAQNVPLHIPAMHGRLDTVEILLKHGADPNEKDSVHHSGALGWARWGSENLSLAPPETYAAVIEALLGAGAEPQ